MSGTGKAADRIRAKGQRVSRENVRPEGAGDQVVSKVRRTVDLTATQHRELNRLADVAADRRQWARVNSQDMLATLIQELLDDEALQERVIGKLPAPTRRGKGGA